MLVRGLERRRADLELADERVLRLAVVVHCTEALQVSRMVAAQALKYSMAAVPLGYR